jgi:hypothetical protein
MSQDHNHLNDSTWVCKYHVVLTPALDCAECGTQAAQFSWPQTQSEGLVRFDRRAGRGDDPRLHQKTGDRGQAVGSVATEARVLIKSRLLYQNPS